MTEEDGRDNTADAHAQAAGGRAAVADAADAFDRTAKERCKFHPHREGGGCLHPRALSPSPTPSCAPFPRNDRATDRVPTFAQPARALPPPIYFKLGQNSHHLDGNPWLGVHCARPRVHAPHPRPSSATTEPPICFPWAWQGRYPRTRTRCLPPPICCALAVLPPIDCPPAPPPLSSPL